MTHFRLISAAFFFLLGGATLAVAQTAGEPSRAMADDHTLDVIEADLSTEVAYDRGRKSVEHEVQLEANITAPDPDTFVCVSENLWAVEAADAEDVAVRVSNTTKRESFTNVFIPLTNGRSEVKLRKVEVPVNPYLIKRLDVQARTILVEEKKAYEVPAHVSDTPTQIGDGLSLRIEQMEIKRNGSASMQVELTRGGGDAPFIVSVFLLDKDGNDIGGGRWNDGKLDLRSDAYMFKSEFEVQNNSPITTVKAVVATRYSVNDVTFSINGLMQE